MEEISDTTDQDAMPIPEFFKLDARLEEDVGTAVEDMILYSRLGLVDDAMEVVNEVLWTHLLFFPVLAEVSLFLVQYNKIPELRSVLAVLSSHLDHDEDSFDDDEKTFIEFLQLIPLYVKAPGEFSPEVPSEAEVKAFEGWLPGIRGRPPTPTEVQTIQIIVTLASLSLTYDDYLWLSARCFHRLMNHKTSWESTYVFSQWCSKVQTLQKDMIVRAIPSLQTMYTRLMSLLNDNQLITIRDVDEMDEHIPELICSMVAKAALSQTLLTSEGVRPGQYGLRLSHAEIVQLRATARRQLQLLLHLVPRATSTSCYVEALGLLSHSGTDSFADVDSVSTPQGREWEFENISSGSVDRTRTRLGLTGYSHRDESRLSHDHMFYIQWGSANKALPQSLLHATDQTSDNLSRHEYTGDRPRRLPGMIDRAQQQQQSHQTEDPTSNESTSLSLKQAFGLSSSSLQVMDFEYDRLNLSDHSIRLFQIQAGGNDDPIRVKMTNFPDRRTPPYVAISHARGISTELREISVNDRAYSIHVSIWQLISHLRKSRETSFLWVDELCINHPDLIERNYHVQRTRSIYTNAESVIIWLGFPSRDRTEHRAMRFVDELAAYHKVYGKYDFGTVWFKSDHQLSWDTLYSMANLDYWNRTWTVQEVCFAHRARMICGDQELEWAKFEAVIDELLRSQPDMNHPVAEKLLQTRMARRILQRKAGQLHLYELLREYHRTKCSDPRDKVYSLLGLARDCAEVTGSQKYFPHDQEWSENRLIPRTLMPQAVEQSVLDEGRDWRIDDRTSPSTFLYANAGSSNDEPFGPHDEGVTQNTMSQSPKIEADYQKSVVDVFLDTFELVRQSLSSSAVLPAAVLTTFRALELKSDDIANYVSKLGEGILPLTSFGHDLKVKPEYVSKVLDVLSHSEIREQFTFGRVPQRSYFRNRIPRAIDAVRHCEKLEVLHNYPSYQDLKVPFSHIALGRNGKASFQNTNLSEPPLIIERNPSSGATRLGFSCANTKPGDLILQFQGLDTTLIVRRQGERMVLVGKAVMIGSDEVEQEMPRDQACELDPWTSHCWCKHNPEDLELTTDLLSLAELLTWE